MKSWLLLDCNYLCYRAFYSTGGLRYKQAHTGVIYGFMRDIITLQDIHATDRMVFCFDYGKSLRCARCPTYKAGRHDNLTDLEKDLRVEMKKQVTKLRTEILPELGFQNIFYEKGYEADDIIASVVNNLKDGHEAIIVSSDHDLYQLLSPTVTIWNPHKGKAITANSFSREYGVEPIQWVDVKAIAGCSSDNIPGIKGVGEKTAAKFLNGQLKAGTAKHNLIVKGNKWWRKNRLLVKLPFPGCPDFVPKRDKLDPKVWRKISQQYGMASIENNVPRAGSKRKGFF